MDELELLKQEIEDLKNEINLLKNLIGAEDKYCGYCGDRVYIVDNHWYCDQCGYINDVVSIPF
jgi:ribosomal protein S27AE